MDTRMARCTGLQWRFLVMERLGARLSIVGNGGVALSTEIVFIALREQVRILRSMGRMA